jgi:hypothetical protein
MSATGNEVVSGKEYERRDCSGGVYLWSNARFLEGENASETWLGRGQEMNYSVELYVIGVKVSRDGAIVAGIASTSNRENGVLLHFRR